MSMKPAVFQGKVSSDCQAATCAFSPLNCILSSFCSCLASQVRANFLHLILRCTTLLSRRDDLSINKWHLINHPLFLLTADKLRSGSARRKVFFSHLKSCFSILFFCFSMTVCLWAWHSCPFSSFHQGFRYGFFFYLCVACQTHRVTAKWVGEGFKHYLPPQKRF